MIEQDIKQSLARRAGEVEVPAEAWAGIVLGVKRARVARTMTVATSGLALLSAIALVVSAVNGQSSAVGDFVGPVKDAGTVHIVTVVEATGEGPARPDIRIVTDTDFRQGISRSAQDDPFQEAITTKEFIFVRGLLVDAFLRGGVSWVRAPITGSGVLLGTSSLMGTFEPTEQIKLLQEHGSMHPTGREQIAGVATTVYEGTVDGDALASWWIDRAPEQYRDQMRKDAARNGDPVFKLWLGDDGLPYRLTALLDLPDRDMKWTMNFSKYGEPVEIDLPESFRAVDDLDSLFRGTAIKVCSSDGGAQTCTEPQPDGQASRTFSCTVSSNGEKSGDC